MSVCMYACVEIEGEGCERKARKRKRAERRKSGAMERVESKVQNKHKYPQMCFGPKLPRKQHLDIFVNV